MPAPISESYKGPDDSPKKLLDQMDENELRNYFNWLASEIESMLPPGPSASGKCLFLLIVADREEPGTGQYVANLRRDGAIKMLRDLANQLAAGRTNERTDHG